MSIAKQVLIQELEEQIHPERVEDVIFWALEAYAKHQSQTFGVVIASEIVRHIKEEELKYQAENN